jgi:4-hydroxy-tetrahydrodipicolinate synthase
VAGVTFSDTAARGASGRGEARSEAEAPAPSGRDRLPLPVGVGVALVTMFTGDGAVDVEATVARAQACVALGVTSVLVAGTTGEAYRLSVDDRIVLASAMKEAVPRTPILVGTGDPIGSRGLEITAAVAGAGVGDALLVLAPGHEDPVAFYREARQAAGAVPLLAYHFPVVSPPGLETSVVPHLEVDGIKDSSGSTNRLAELVEAGVRVYVGSPTALAVAGACGAAGALLAVANVAPSLCLAAWSGDMAAQRRLFALHVRTGADFPGYLKGTPPDGA